MATPEKLLVLYTGGTIGMQASANGLAPASGFEARMREQLAHALHEDWIQAYEQHKDNGAYRPDPVSSGRRALAGMALTMLCLAARENGNASLAASAPNKVAEITDPTPTATASKSAAIKRLAATSAAAIAAVIDQLPAAPDAAAPGTGCARKAR